MIIIVQCGVYLKIHPVGDGMHVLLATQLHQRENTERKELVTFGLCA